MYIHNPKKEGEKESKEEEMKEPVGFFGKKPTLWGDGIFGRFVKHAGEKTVHAFPSSMNDVFRAKRRREE